MAIFPGAIDRERSKAAVLLHPVAPVAPVAGPRFPAEGKWENARDAWRTPSRRDARDFVWPELDDVELDDTWFQQWMVPPATQANETIA